MIYYQLLTKGLMWFSITTISASIGTFTSTPVRRDIRFQCCIGSTLLVSAY